MYIKNSLKIVKPIETNEAYQKVLFWFFSFPYKKVGLNDLVKQLKISKTTANKVITRLIKEDFIRKEVAGKTWRLSCNVEHEYNKSKKICYNLNMVYQSGILEEIYKKFKNPRAIILFGSYRKGDDTETSDIDIAIEVLGDEKLKIKELSIFKQFGYRKNISVNLHIFSRTKINNNLFSNMANGFVLDGFLEVKK